MARLMSITVEVGDVIDLREALVTSTHQKPEKRKDNLFIVLRSENKNNTMAVFAPESAKNLVYGRVTQITKVNHYCKRFNTGFRNCTDVYVELENAWGEEPTLIAENLPLIKTEAEIEQIKNMAMPEFRYGSIDHAEKEEG